jgi:hypothetical protein
MGLRGQGRRERAEREGGGTGTLYLGLRPLQPRVTRRYAMLPMRKNPKARGPMMAAATIHAFKGRCAVDGCLLISGGERGWVESLRVPCTQGTSDPPQC